MEDKDRADREEDRYKFDLFTHDPEAYERIFGDKQTEAIESGAEFLVPQSEAEMREIMAMFKAQEAER